MSYRYAIIGSGRQGISSAYDFIVNGEAEEILLIDNDIKALIKAREILRGITDFDRINIINLDIDDESRLKEILSNADSMISGVPYYYNLTLTRLAIETKTHMFDFGGNTNVVEQQLALHDQAAEAGISIVPDCGMDPGLNISMIMYLVDTFDSVSEIRSYGAGLAQNPIPPWNYNLTFHINGLTNEYHGNALFIRNGETVQVPCFEGVEKLIFPAPIGELEAAVTSGGLSTLPMTLKGRVKTLENKTLRYPGHWERFKAYSDLGLFELEPVKIGDTAVVPRDLYHKLLEPKIAVDSPEDIGIIKIIGEGILNGKERRLELELIDYYDKNTGLTAMQRLTGWHASIMAIYASKNKLAKGILPVQAALGGKEMMDEFRNRGVSIVEKTI